MFSSSPEKCAYSPQAATPEVRRNSYVRSLRTASTLHVWNQFASLANINRCLNREVRAAKAVRGLRNRPALIKEMALQEPKSETSLPATDAQGYPCASAHQPRQIPFREALRFWIKLGFISFGGPAGQIALMHRELVERRRWLSNERFLHALNYCMLLPGPEAQQLATYVGWLMHRTWGGIAAGVFFVIPSIFVLLGLSFTYAFYGKLPAVAGMLSGFKPVVVAIVVEAVIRIGNRALKRGVHFLFAALAFAAIYFFHVPFPLIVLTAGVLGFLASRAWPAVFSVADSKSKRSESSSDSSKATEGLLPLVIDDHLPPPPHTVPSRSRAIRVLCLGLILWVTPLAFLVAWQGQ